MRNCPEHDADDNQGRVERIEQAEENKAADDHETRPEHIGSLPSDAIRHVSGQRYGEKLEHGKQQDRIEQEASIHFEVSRSVGKDERRENVKWSLLRETNQCRQNDSFWL